MVFRQNILIRMKKFFVVILSLFLCQQMFSQENVVTDSLERSL